MRNSGIRGGSRGACPVKSGLKMPAGPLKCSFGSNPLRAVAEPKSLGLEIRRWGVILVLEKGGGQVGYRQMGSVG
jgi:hypothetical protein